MRTFALANEQCTRMKRVYSEATSTHSFRRDGRVVECTGLENRRTERYRGFESLSLRQNQRNEL